MTYKLTLFQHSWITYYSPEINLKKCLPTNIYRHLNKSSRWYRVKHGKIYNDVGWRLSPVAPCCFLSFSLVIVAFEGVIIHIPLPPYCELIIVRCFHSTARFHWQVSDMPKLSSHSAECWLSTFHGLTQ